MTTTQLSTTISSAATEQEIDSVIGVATTRLGALRHSLAMGADLIEMAILEEELIAVLGAASARRSALRAR